ncbi:MAG: hypothetical protein E3J60_04475 [Dehalococcoidia bacterium]|nr:MAG: hypothetical protein E3J60_04475 [Dehalococcoidia bacterium]
MTVLGVVITIICFLYLSLLALLRAGRQRREQERSAYKKLPRVSYEVIQTLGTQLTKFENQGKLNQANENWIAELMEEQPFLFALLNNIENPRGLDPAFIVYKLLKAQMEADLLGRSLHQPHH